MKTKILVNIKDNHTGEIRTFETHYEGDEFSVYIWREGNYSCDCNRGIFFYQAIRETPPENLPCGDGRYSVNISNAKTGDVLYREFGD